MYEYIGSTLDEAIEKATKDLHMTRNVLDVEVLEEKKSFFSRNRWVKIRVYVNEQPLQESSSSYSPPSSASLEAETDFEHAILDFIRGLTKKLQLRAEVYFVDRKDEDLFVEIVTPDASFLIGKRGMVFDALQMLIFSVAHNLGNEKRVLIDMNDYRKNRERHLAEMARKIFRQVKRTGRSVILKPMSPWERLIIHQTIDDLGDAISTVSVGNDKSHIKQVKIFLNE